MRFFLTSRLLGFAACVGLFIISCIGLWWNIDWIWGVLASGALIVVGIHDLVQRKRAVSHNYPILAHFRYFLESIGPEIRQYFIERDTEENPFSRLQRSVVYQRAKGERDTRPFGTQIDVYANDELRLAVGQCDPRTQRGREDGQFLPRHR
jgi:glutamate synthase domain-containing protein 2